MTRYDCIIFRMTLWQRWIAPRRYQTTISFGQWNAMSQTFCHIVPQNAELCGEITPVTPGSVAPDNYGGQLYYSAYIYIKLYYNSKYVSYRISLVAIHKDIHLDKKRQLQMLNILHKIYYWKYYTVFKLNVSCIMVQIAFNSCQDLPGLLLRLSCDSVCDDHSLMYWYTLSYIHCEKHCYIYNVHFVKWGCNVLITFMRNHVGVRDYIMTLSLLFNLSKCFMGAWAILWRHHNHSLQYYHDCIPVMWRDMVVLVRHAHWQALLLLFLTAPAAEYWSLHTHPHQSIILMTSHYVSGWLVLMTPHYLSEQLYGQLYSCR